MSTQARFIWATIVNFIFLGLWNYWGMPTMSWGFTGWLFMIFIGGGIYTLFSLKEEEEFQADINSYIGIPTMAISLLILILTGIFGTSKMANDQDYVNLLGDVNEVTQTRDLTPTDISKIIFADDGVVKTLGDKQISDADNLAIGSQVEIGEYTEQLVDGNVYQVAPVLHRGLFKYWRNKMDGSPGYIIVDKVNTNDARYVKEIGGEKIQNVYQRGGYFKRNLKRHLRRNGYRNIGLDDFSYELDDEFMPHWVVTKYDNTIGFSGSEPTGVVIVDPKSGEIKDYDIGEIPSWVDRVYPMSFVKKQINDWGRLAPDGWWNPSDQGKLKLSTNITIVYDEQGNCYYYSGLTSYGSDNTSVGFILVDTRTKEVTFYKNKGIVELAARQKAEGAYQNFNYTATEPRFYNLNGVYTYAVGLKGKDGLVNKYSFISYQNQKIIGTGDNPKTAYRDYKTALNSKNNLMVGEEYGNKFELEGIVQRINRDVKSGNTYYSIILNTQPNKLFKTTSDVSDEIINTTEGDKVVVGFNDGDYGVIDILEFDNLNIEIEKTDRQIGIEKKAEKVDKLQEKKMLEQDFEGTIEQMNEKEKKEFLEEKRKQE